MNIEFDEKAVLELMVASAGVRSATLGIGEIAVSRLNDLHRRIREELPVAISAVKSGADVDMDSERAYEVWSLAMFANAAVRVIDEFYRELVVESN